MVEAVRTEAALPEEADQVGSRSEEAVDHPCSGEDLMVFGSDHMVRSGRAVRVDHRLAALVHPQLCAPPLLPSSSASTLFESP